MIGPRGDTGRGREQTDFRIELLDDSKQLCHHRGRRTKNTQINISVCVEYALSSENGLFRWCGGRAEAEFTMESLRKHAEGRRKGELQPISRRCINFRGLFAPKHTHIHCCRTNVFSTLQGTNGPVALTGGALKAPLPVGPFFQQTLVVAQSCVIMKFGKVCVRLCVDF